MIAEEMLKRQDLMLIIHKFTGVKHDYRRKAQWMPMLTGGVKNVFNRRVWGENSPYFTNKAVENIMTKNIVVAIDKPLFSPTSM